MPWDTEADGLSVIRVGVLGMVLGSWLHPGPAMAGVGVGEASQWVRDLSVCLSNKGTI